MKILVISDIHDYFDNLQKVLNLIPKLGVKRIFCLGDIINGGIGQMLASQNIPTHLVWGNNDGNKLGVLRKFLKYNNGSIISDFEFDEITVKERKIFLTHYPLLAKNAIKSGDYDAVFFGHNHKKSNENINNCLSLNPGDICGSRYGIGSYAIYDTISNTADIFDITKGYGVKNMVDVY